MFVAPSSPLDATLQAAVVAALCLGFGYLVGDALLGRRCDVASKLGLALAGVILFVLAVMALHMATGGRVLSNPALVRLITLGTAMLLVINKIRGPRKEGAKTLKGVPLVALACVVILGWLLWGIPLMDSVPLHFSGDTKVHMAWASQLLNGETTPTAVITGEVPNYYPWLFHAVAAWLSHLTPGGRAIHTLAPLQLIVVTGSVLALFALGRHLTRSWVGASAASLFGALAGGFGFFIARAPVITVDPRGRGGDEALDYLGDLLSRRSYNSSFGNLSPPFPRDITYALFFTVLMLLVIGLVRKEPVILLAAGVVVGLIGLIGGETFLVAGAMLAVVAVLPWGMSKFRVAGLLLGPALAISGLWLLPLAINYIKLGGFVNTAGPLVKLPAHAILFSWGILTPFAVFGAFRTWPLISGDVRTRLVAVIVAVAALLLTLSGLIAEVFGEGFTTLSRSHRYWPVLYGALVPLGAIGAADALHRLATAHRRLAIGLGVIVVAMAVPSPLLGSLGIMDAYEPDRLLAQAATGGDGTLLNVLSRGPGDSCTAAVPPGLAAQVTGYTGYRLVYFPSGGRRQARIRWTEIPDMIRGRRRLSENHALIFGLVEESRIRTLVDKYDIDMVVALPAGTEAFTPWPIENADGYSVVRFTRCGL
jgi:hypothetical protein